MALNPAGGRLSQEGALESTQSRPQVSGQGGPRLAGGVVRSG